MIHYNPIQCNRTIIIMIKFNDQLQRKQIGQNGFLVAQTTVKRYENKTNKKDQPTNNIKKKQKNKSNGAMDHYARSGQMGDIDP